MDKDQPFDRGLRPQKPSRLLGGVAWGVSAAITAFRGLQIDKSGLQKPHRPI